MAERKASIRSMTGYAQASAEVGASRVTVEMRTVNHRYADLRLRLPSGLAERESEIRRQILRRVRRGRVEFGVSVDPLEGNEPRPQLNRPLLESVLEASSTIRAERSVEGNPDLATILSIPGMFRPAQTDAEWDDSLRGAFDGALGQALDALDADRTREGEHLREELVARLVGMWDHFQELKVRAEAMPSTVLDRLKERLAALSRDVDLEPARVAQEAAILADRCDVTEELVRLEGHLGQARSLLERPDDKPLGKRLDFLMQEINRETNTVNSKSSDLELSRGALALKAEIEKVREQVQNLE